jgi:hypothetical protein
LRPYVYTVVERGRNLGTLWKFVGFFSQVSFSFDDDVATFFKKDGVRKNNSLLLEF